MYGIWRRKEVVGCFKVIIWDGNASHKGGGSFYGEGEFSLCNAVVLKLYLSLNGTVKDFIGYLISLYYSCFTCFIFIEIGRPKVQFNKVS